MNDVAKITAPFYELIDREEITNAELSSLLGLQTGQIAIKRKNRKFSLSEMMVISEHYGYEMSLSVTTYSDDPLYFSKEDIGKDITEIRRMIKAISDKIDKI